MKLLQDKYSMNDTVHLTAVPGISVAKGGERELASAEVQESDTVRNVGPFDLRGGQAVFRFDGGHIYIPLKADHQPHFFYYHVKDHLGNVRVTKIGRAAPAKASAKAATALTCLVYNIFRYVQINKYQPQLIASMG